MEIFPTIHYKIFDLYAQIVILKLQHLVWEQEKRKHINVLIVEILHQGMENDVINVGVLKGNELKSWWGMLESNQTSLVCRTRILPLY